MNTNFTHQIRNSCPSGLIHPQTARWSAPGSYQAGDGIPSL